MTPRFPQFWNTYIAPPKALAFEANNGSWATPQRQILADCVFAYNSKKGGWIDITSSEPREVLILKNTPNTATISKRYRLSYNQYIWAIGNREAADSKTAKQYDVDCIVCLVAS